MSGLRFDVVAEMAVTVDPNEPIPARVSEPMTARDRQIAAYRARNAAYLRARRIPGFQGYSLRPGFDFVISGEHVALGVSA